MITKEDARAAAEKGLIEALKCSIAHHEDPGKMTSLELQVAIDKDKFDLDSEQCALCVFQSIGCSLCVLDEVDSCLECCKEYRFADKALDVFNADPSNANHAAFLEAEEKMVVRLKEELAKAEWEQVSELCNREKEEVAYSVGDRFKGEGGKELILASTSRTEAIMINSENGEYHNNPETVKNLHKITQTELDKICFCDPVRIWDARKKEKC